MAGFRDKISKHQINKNDNNRIRFRVEYDEFKIIQYRTKDQVLESRNGEKMLKEYLRSLKPRALATLLDRDPSLTEFVRCRPKPPSERASITAPPA